MRETKVKTRTHIHKIKCATCSLHFAAYSDNDNWKPQYCPECGSAGPFFHWYDTSTLFIFEHIPGTAQLMAMD